MARRRSNSSPPPIGTVVSSQLVAPASSVPPKPVSKPVPMSSPTPRGQYGFGCGGQPMKQLAAKSVAAGSQTSKKARFTLTGLLLLSKVTLPLIEPIGGGFTSAMY